MSKSVLFYWSKGAKTRLRVLHTVWKCNKENKPCYLNTLAKALSLSHVAVKKHVDLMVEEGFLKELNPSGKPVYLSLTREGERALEEIKRSK